MKLTAALVALSILGLAAPAAAADFGGSREGWGHHRHIGHKHRARYGYHPHRHVVTEQVVEVVEYREPYLPRGVLYNAPPLPLAYGYASERYRDVISAKY